MKKKILFILHMPPPLHGASTVGKYLKESSIINDTFDAHYINLATAFSLDQMGKTGSKKIFALLKLQSKVIRALVKQKHDLCYVSFNSHGPGFYKDLLVVFLLKVFRKNIIYHFHNKGVLENQHKGLDNLLYKYAFNKAKCIVLSKLLYSDIAKYAKADNVFYCSNGIPQVVEIANLEQKLTKTVGTCRILFVSNMYVAKGVFDLVRACKILRTKKYDFECHFVGDWAEITEEQMTEEVLQNGLSDVIFLHGKKIGQEKFAHFQNAEIFVLPSHNECFPLVNLEAMQFALPIISTTTGGIPDMIRDGETGFLVPPRDYTALAERLEILITNAALRRHMGLAGRKLYETSYTLEKFEQNIKVILNEALQN